VVGATVAFRHGSGVAVNTSIHRRSPSSHEWVPTEKGAHLRGRVTRNTKPEVELRRAVHALGFRFRLHRRVVAQCTPDFVLPRWKVFVFVDGCFWHGCPSHSPTHFKGPNAERWRQKIDTNRSRDRRNDELLTAAGWTVIRVWECEIRRDPAEAARRVASTARIAADHDPAGTS
jgi:DNA mismatch endonuclease, patch repair protein